MPEFIFWFSYFAHFPTYDSTDSLLSATPANLLAVRRVADPFSVELPSSTFALSKCTLIVSDIDEYPQHTKRTSKQGVSDIKTDIHSNPWDVFFVSSSNPETNELLAFVHSSMSWIRDIMSS